MRRAFLPILLALLACVLAGPSAIGQSRNPVVARTPHQIQVDIEDNDMAMRKIMDRNTLLGSIKERPDAAKDYIPLLKKRIALQEELARTPGSGGPASVRSALLQDTAALIALGDADTAKTVASNAKSFTADGSTARLCQYLAAWYGDYADAAGQTKTLNAVRELAKTNPADETLSGVVFAMMYTNPATAELHDAAEAIIVNTLRTPAAMTYRNSPHLDRAYVLTGMLTTGGQFTTAKLKGKVVLIHFWQADSATARAALGDVKKFLADYGAKGLEAVGVPTDASAPDLAAYLLSNKDVTWPQLYDPRHPQAVAAPFDLHDTNLFTIIDRNGVIRAMNTRDGIEETLVKLLEEKPTTPGSATRPGARP